MVTLLGMAHVPEGQFRHRKNKVAQRSELVERGLWAAFVERREALKAGGMAAPEAWGQAFDEVTSGSVPVVASESVSTGEAPEKSGTPDSGLERVNREVFADRTCSITRTVEWVAKQMMVDNPSAEDAPSMEAWSMLSWARRSNQNEAQFWGQIWAKMMPSKQQLEASERLSDDGSAVLELIERVRAISEKVNGEANDSEETIA